MSNFVPIGRKKIFKQNLIEFQTKIVDSSINSKNYFNVEFPSILKAGKNLIKLKPTGSINADKILIEILDSNNNPIVYEFSEYKDKDNAILINAIIYPETANGIGSITLIGVASIDLITFLPITNLNDYNIKWSSEIEINKYSITESTIIFDEYPEITINKNFVPYNNLDFISGRNVTISGSIDEYYYLPSMKLTTENEFDIKRKSLASDSSQSTISENAQINLDNVENIEIKFVQKKDTRIVAPNGFAFEEFKRPVVSIDGTFGYTFTKEMIGAEITISNITQPSLPANHYFSSSIDLNYETTITRVLNSTTIELAEPFVRRIYKLNSTTNKKLYSNYVFHSFSGGTATIVYNGEPTYTASEYYNNNASINIQTLNPFSGLIDKIKIYEKSSAAQVPYKLIHEEEILSKNIFIDSNNIIPDYSVGDFKSLAHFNTYWDYSGSGPVDPTSNAYLLNSIYLYKSRILPKTGINVYANHKYQIIFNLIGSNETNEDNLDVDATGTCVNSTTNIATITISEDKELKYNNLSFLFEPEKDGTFFINFNTSSGFWYISDVRILSFAEYGFNPKLYNFKIPINPLWPNEIVNFKFEFYNSKNEKSNQFVEIKNIIFDSYTPTIIAGDYNLLSGSLKFGSISDVGIELFGSATGSYIKSKGYEGQAGTVPGFMLWSGSVSAGSESYSDVGIEIYVSDTKKIVLSSDPLKEDIVQVESGTFNSSDFLFGDSTKALGFISGSNGTVEARIYKSGSYQDSIFHITAFNDMYPADQEPLIYIDVRSSAAYHLTGMYLQVINTRGTGSSYNYGLDNYTSAGSGDVRGVNIDASANGSGDNAYGIYSKGRTGSNGYAYGGYFIGQVTNSTLYKPFGIYASAVDTVGTSTGYAGYFDDGDVYIANNVEIQGSMDIESNIICSGSVDSYLGFACAGYSGITSTFEDNIGRTVRIRGGIIYDIT